MYHTPRPVRLRDRSEFDPEIAALLTKADALWDAVIAQLVQRIKDAEAAAPQQNPSAENEEQR